MQLLLEPLSITPSGASQPAARTDATEVAYPLAFYPCQDSLQQG
jgi:hypothetical protein